jgi:hypothetical protein
VVTEVSLFRCKPTGLFPNQPNTIRFSDRFPIETLAELVLKGVSAHCPVAAGDFAPAEPVFRVNGF